jgi:hypothetical protein
LYNIGPAAIPARGRVVRREFTPDILGNIGDGSVARTRIECAEEITLVQSALKIDPEAAWEYESDA